MDSAGTRRPCFIEEDQGLASIAGVEAGFLGNPQTHHPFFSRSSTRRASFRTHSFGRVSSPRFYDPRFEDHQPHFLEACFLCKKQLGDNRDIFMYRGDTPFCSEECRQEQIEIDEVKEKNWNLTSMKALRKKEQTQSKSQKYSFRTGAVAAA